MVLVQITSILKKLKKEIYTCNTPDYGIEEVSDTAIAFALNFVRGILEYDLKSKLITDGSWQENTIESKDEPQV